MDRSQTWSDKPLFNTSGGQCPELFDLQGDGGGVGQLCVHGIKINHP